MRHIGKNRMKFSAAEIKRRRDRGPHILEPVAPQDQPINEPLEVVGVKLCQVCGYRPTHDTVVCPLCKNCQYCGLYNPDEDTSKCVYCGNTLSDHKRNATIEAVETLKTEI